MSTRESPTEKKGEGLVQDLSPLVPIIKRARGYRLYDLNGNRILDLYQSGGAALLGHRGVNLTHHLKNVLSQGLLFELPSVYEKRLRRELRRRYPAFPSSFVFADRLEALGFLSRHLGREVEWDRIADPVWEERGPAAFHRLCLPVPSFGADLPRALLPLLPYRIGHAPVVVCVREPPREAESRPAAVSALLLTAVLRSLADLERFEQPPWYAGGALEGIHGWRQRGPYVLPDFEEAEYPAVFRRFLEGGCLLSPRYREPSILPGEASPGEWEKMIRLFRRFPGK